MYVVGADGGECISDAVIETRRILRTAAGLKGETYGEPASRFAFEFPGSVQGFAPCPLHKGRQAVTRVGNLNISGEANGLELGFEALAAGVTGAVSVPTFIDPKPRGVSDTSYFEVIASPTLYPTQTVNGTIRGFADDNPTVRFFIHYFDETDQLSRLDGEWIAIEKGDNKVRWTVPDTGGRPIHRLGIELGAVHRLSGKIGIIELDWKGAPDNLTFGTSKELTPRLTPWDTTTFWTKQFVSSAKHWATDIYNTFTLSHPDKNGVITFGTREWTDYAIASELVIELHEMAGLVVRARGHRRYYAGVVHDGKASIVKRRDGELLILASVPFDFVPNSRQLFEVSAVGDRITLAISGKLVVEALDADYASGGAGFLIEGGTVPARGLSVRRIGA
jgi:hypothetical protein